MRILITGASGQLGSYLLRHLSGDPNVDVAGWSGSPCPDRFGMRMRAVDLRHPHQVQAAFREDLPRLVIHAAAVCRVSTCHADPELAECVNLRGTSHLVKLAAEHGARLIYISTDLVFDGEQGGYREVDKPAPLSVYGRSKLAGEECVLAYPNSVVVRVSLLFGPSLNTQPTFFDQQCAALKNGRPLTLFTDEWRTPLSLLTASRAIVELALTNTVGMLHLGGPERMSRWEMGQRLASSLGCNPDSLVAADSRTANFPEPRPRDVSLDSTRWRTLFPQQPWPKWDAALRELGITGDK